jgi:hypothetical protein
MHVSDAYTKLVELLEQLVDPREIPIFHSSPLQPVAQYGFAALRDKGGRINKAGATKRL